MNAKSIITAVSIAFAASGTMAIEATQFDDTPSTLTRAEVKAELAAAKTNASVLIGGEATEFVDHPVAAAGRTRQEVRAEAVMANRDHFFNQLYVGA